MRFILMLALACPLWAIVTVPITDQTGSTQTNRPISIPMTFKCGDVPNFPQPTINGVAVVSWQSDIRNRYTVTQCADGSVERALISFYATIPAGGTISVDFVNNVNPCSSGNQAACDAAAMSIGTMQGLSWNAQIEAVASGITKTFNPRTILNACGSISTNPGTLGCRYWAKGPVRTVVILEDRDTTRAFDDGWTCTANCTSPYPSATWVNDATHKSLHPQFIVEFWAGTSFIQFSTVALENMWGTHLQDQAYAVTIKTGAALTNVAYTKAYFTHYFRTRWRKSFWNGAAPGAVKMDLNLAYMISTGAVPNYDLSKAPSVSGDNVAFAASDRCDINGHGLFDTQMGDTGGRPELGLISGWYVRAMYTMDPTAVANMLLAGDCWGSVQESIRESGTGLFYDSAHLVNAFGRTFSVDAHPSGQINGVTFPQVGPTSFTPAFTGFNLAHQPGFSYVPYLFSGDYYTLESLQLQVASDLANTDPTNQPYGRNGAMGLINGRAQQLRGEAWGFRDLTHGTVTAVDGTPEAAYFLQKLNNNIGAWEGWYNITNGQFNGSAAWLFGRNIEATPYEPNPLRYPQYPDCCAGSLGWLQATVQLMESPLEMHFLTTALGHMIEQGFPFQKVQQVYAAVPINMMLNPTYNKWLVAAYRVAEFFNSNPNKFATTWPQVLAGYTTSPTNYQTINTWPVADQTDCNAGFTHYTLASTSFLAGVTLLPADGSYSGANAWTFVNDPAQGISNATCLNSNPMWAFLPRVATPPTPPTITSSCPLPVATQGSAYSQQATALGDTPMSWDLVPASGTFPTGINMTSTGAITGTPSGSGTSNFTLRATNAVGNNTKACSLTVNIPGVPPTITSATPLPSGTVNVPYNGAPLTASGDVPLTWTVTVGSLPTGLSLNASSGAITGTPTVIQNPTFTIRAANSSGFNTKVFTLAINGPTGNQTVTVTGTVVIPAVGITGQ